MHPRYKVTMERYQEVMVALSESVTKNCLKHHLTEDWQWRHIRLAIKPHYLVNYASQIKSYYGTPSGSFGRSFRIRHEKSPEAPPSGEITLTSYPACNKTSFILKLCTPFKSYYGTLSGSHGRSFRICHEKLPKALPGEKITMTWCPACNTTALARKPCIRDKKSYYGTVSGSNGCSFRIRPEKSREASPGGGLTITSYPVGNTTSLSRKYAWYLKKCYESLTVSYNRSFRIRHEKVCAAFPGGGLTMTSCTVGNKTSLSRKPCIADKCYYGSLSWSLGRY